MVKTETLPGRTDHEVYPTWYMITIGSVGGGFTFYGPFKTPHEADKWSINHFDLCVGDQRVGLALMHYVEDEK